MLGVHGALPEEQDRAQPFEIDLDVEADLSVAGASDHLADTVDYGAVAAVVAAVVGGERFRLLERLAERVADEVADGRPPDPGRHRHRPQAAPARPRRPHVRRRPHHPPPTGGPAPRTGDGNGCQDDRTVTGSGGGANW